MGAARRGDADRVSWLLEQGADPAATDTRGERAVHHAFGNVEYSHRYVQPAASPATTRTAMALIEAMVARGTPLAVGLCDEEHPLINCAARCGCVPAVRALLEAGVPADADKRDRRPSALAGAALGSHSAVVSLLLAAGANVNRPYKDEEGTGNALSNAVLARTDTPDQMNAAVATIDTLLRAGAKLTYDRHNAYRDSNILRYAVQAYMPVGTVLVLLDARPDGCVPDDDDDAVDYAMVFACSTNQVDVVRALLARGWRAKAAQGRFDYVWEAAHNGNLELVQRLADAGARIDGVFPSMTPLGVALSDGHGAVAAYLRSKGCCK